MLKLRLDEVRVLLHVLESERDDCDPACPDGSYREALLGKVVSALNALHEDMVRDGEDEAGLVLKIVRGE